MPQRPVRRESVRTPDLVEAREKVSGLVAPHQLTVVAGADLFEARMDLVRVGSVAVSRLEYGAHVVVRPAEIVGSYVIHCPLRGHLRASSGRREVHLTSRTGAMAQPGGPFRLDWPAGSPLQLVQVSEAALRQELRHQLGDEPRARLRFDLDQVLTEPVMRRWLQMVAGVSGDGAADRSLVGHSLIGRDVEQMLVTGLLMAARHSYSSMLRDEVRPAPAQRVHAAIDYMRSHVDQPITIPQVAAAVGVGIRHLEAAFRSTAQTTPRRYLRRLRLEAARNDLQHGSWGRTSVTQVALRWGFSRLGEFARLYRAAFGESPSVTLRKDKR
jgi:AraC-like DNA-binding protein